MADSGGLTAKQRAAVHALVTCHTVAEAERVAAVSSSTLLRWRKEPAFRAALREAESELYRDGLRQLLADQSTNLERMTKLRDGAETDAVQLRAAVALESALARRFEGLALEQIEDRIAALEAAMMEPNDDDDN